MRVLVAEVTSHTRSWIVTDRAVPLPKFAPSIVTVALPGATVDRPSSPTALQSMWPRCALRESVSATITGGAYDNDALSGDSTSASLSSTLTVMVMPCPTPASASTPHSTPKP